jgi:hypothetical protein
MQSTPNPTINLEQTRPTHQQYFDRDSITIDNDDMRRLLVGRAGLSKVNGTF